MLAALDQRIAVRYQMAPMTSQETTGYLIHHTRLAGRSDTLFSDDAAAEPVKLNETSGGWIYPTALLGLDGGAGLVDPDPGGQGRG